MDPAPRYSTDHIALDPQHIGKEPKCPKGPRNNDADTRCLATETLGWEDSDPKAIHSWFQSLFDIDDTAQVRRLIRYLKAWSILNIEAPPASILVTVLVADAYQTLTNDQAASDDVALLNLSRIIADRLEGDAEVPNPAQPDEDLDRLSPEELQVFIEQLGIVRANARPFPILVRRTFGTRVISFCS